MAELDIYDAPEGYIAQERDDNFCYACAFHTLQPNHDFNKCVKESGYRCQPGWRNDNLFVVFIKEGGA